MNTTVIAWNPERLKADHLAPPRSLADLADPRWKGKFAIDAGALNWYLGTLQADPKDGLELMRRLAANDPIRVAGHTQAVTQLEAGEYDATPTVYGYMAETDKRAGRPIDYVVPTPVLVSLNPSGMAKNAPHPNAARLFLQWQLSREGQQWMVDYAGEHEASSRRDVRMERAYWDPQHPYVVVKSPSIDAYNTSEKAFAALFGIPR
jgi:iron(III) transport system substrate-binding protein